MSHKPKPKPKPKLTRFEKRQTSLRRYARAEGSQPAAPIGKKNPPPVTPAPAPSDAPTRPEGSKPIPKPDPVFAILWLIVQGIRKYGDDVIAWLMIAFALITTLGIYGFSSGALLDVWSNFLRTGLGWGAFLAPLTIGAVAVGILFRSFGWRVRVRWGRVIAAEGAAVALLGLLNIFNQDSIALAVSGRGGGLVGWALGLMALRLLPPPADALMFGLTFILCLVIALGLTGRRMARVREWLRLNDAPEHLTAPDELAPPEAVSSAPKRPAAPGREALLERKPAKPQLSKGERITVAVETAAKEKAKPKKRDKRLPPLDLLDSSELRRPAQKDIDETASIIVKTLKEFGIPVNVVGAKVGPSVTQYQVEPGFIAKPGPDGMSKQWKVRVAQISSLNDDLALALSANTLRIEAPVPGQSYVGIEVPHRRTSLVSLRPVMESEAFQKISSPLALALGRDVSGAAVAADLGTMPHMLIAGTTGSGKSVCITALVMCLACHNTPDDLRMVLIDPKMVELVRFNGLPHLFGKVETELDRIIGVLRWVVKEMDRRYKLFEVVAARNLDNYNSKTAKKANAERLPRIVVVIDELADLMMQAPDETERTVVRLAQMARATGIHLVVATQRPSTDIVTGLIKANFPARISFAVASGIDSRVILDTQGAEALLGRGDMLFLAPEVGTPIRVQGCFVGDKEMERVVAYWRTQIGDDEVNEEIKIDHDDPTVRLKPGQAPWDVMLAREAVVDDKDKEIEQAIAIIQKHGRASASLLQRKMRLGYPRAARLMDELKAMGIIGREQAGGKTREVFIEEDDDPIGDRAAEMLEDDEED